MIRKSLLWKLVLAFLLVAIITAGLVAVFIHFTSIDRLTNLVIDQQRSSLETALSDYYIQKGSWDGVADEWQQLRSQLITPIPGRTEVPSRIDRPSNRDRFRLFGLADNQGRVVVSVDQTYPAGSMLPDTLLKGTTPVMVNGKKVGSILMANVAPRLNPEETLFLQRTTEALIFAVIGAMLIALVIAVFLAQTLLRPIRALTDATQRIAEGHLEQEVKVKSKDEIGQLAISFNRMSQEVARVNRLRKQMTADIAHDLRTPLTVIAGYIESMRDGVLQPTPERMTIIYTEIERLQNLVGDLKMLSQVDAGELPMHPQWIDPKSMLEHVAQPFLYKASQQGITISVDAPDDLPAIKVDESRMMQIFGNLLSNAFRYTPEGGKICLSAKSEQNQVILSIEDNGEGIEADELPLIFDRFHRADKSRHTEGGESGLGLAIVKALVEAHGGLVQAFSKYGEGTCIQISLPAAPMNELIIV